MKFRFVLAAVLSCSMLSTSQAYAVLPLPQDPGTQKANASLDLLRAAATGDVPLLNSAIKRGAPLEIRDSQYLFTPLGWAAWKGQTRAVIALLNAGAKTEARSTGGAPMPVTITIPLLGSMTAPEPSDQTPLALAILGNTPQTIPIVRDLLRHGANPNAQNGTGTSPFLYATMFSRPAVIDAMLAKGADVNLRGGNGLFSPLTGVVLHVEGEDPALVKKLLAAGANPNEVFFRGPLSKFARVVKRTRSAELIEAAQKTKLQNQIREAAKPPVLYPESNSVPAVLN